MRKIMLVVVVVILLSSTLCFAEESKSRYKLFESTAMTYLVGNSFAYDDKKTFLLDTYTGDVWMYVPGEGWKQTQKNGLLKVKQ